MLSRACETSALKQQLYSVQQRIEEPGNCDRIIGSSPGMQRVYQLVRSVTNLNAAVLVTGESGTGKELIARAIHNLGSRANKPFVAVSCGAIPETLIEAELFGHEKGAFTGTVGAREGYFEQAADGTLFLDEIGDLSLFTQVKLLRVLQQMEFSRLGSNKLIPLRARLIFATHQDLAKLVAEGKFRQDLYYRINVMRIESPPLQDRPEDIPLIAQPFPAPLRGRLPEAHGRDRARCAGHAPELRLARQRARARKRDAARHHSRPRPRHPRRGPEPQDHEQEEDPGAFDEVVDIADYQPAGSFERQLRDYKVRLAVAAVRENNGNKTLAARSLSISRAYLHRLLRLAETDAEAIYTEPPLRHSVTA